jgi:hypothetical protein
LWFWPTYRLHTDEEEYENESTRKGEKKDASLYLAMMPLSLDGGVHQRSGQSSVQWHRTAEVTPSLCFRRSV